MQDFAMRFMLSIYLPLLEQDLLWSESLANSAALLQQGQVTGKRLRAAPARNAAGKKTARMRQQIGRHEGAIPGQPPAL